MNASKSRGVMIASRVTPEESKMIRVAASLDGLKMTDFLRRLAIPAAAERLERAAKEGFTRGPLTPAA
jgi:uncharacterized protein (DUF1778 family)